MFWILVPLAHAETPATVTSADGVNLRSGPDTTFPVVAVMPFGAAVMITGDALPDNWLPVSYKNQIGFAKGEFLSVSSAQQSAPAPTPASPTPTPTPTPTPSATPTAAASSAPVYALVTPPDGVNLRVGPATAFPVLIPVPGGARVQVIGSPTSDGWYSVSYNGKLGWVLGTYIAIGATAPAGPAAPATPATPSRFIWPVESRRISTTFSGGHPGIDIDEYPVGGNPVVASAAGTVTFAGGTTCCSYGLYVTLRHADGFTTLYAHLQSIAVSEGQSVTQGQVLGKSGNTGFSTGAHLHFEMKKDGGAVDPLAYLTGSYSIE